MSGQKTTYSITDTVKIGKENSMARVKNGKLHINRTMYKNIKKYDREQMNDLLQDIYETGVKSGYKKGLQEVSEGPLRNNILNEIQNINGIGPTKLGAISVILKTRLKELVRDEPE